MINTALTLVARDKLQELIVENVAALGVLTSLQMSGVRGASKAVVDWPIADALAYISAGDFQSVGFPEVASEPLTDTQRAQIASTVATTARGIIEEEITRLQGLITGEAE